MTVTKCADCGEVMYQDNGGVWQCPNHRVITQETAGDIVSQITAKRGPIYGPFLHNGIVSQAIKEAMRNIPDPDNEGSLWQKLPPDAREALDLMATKMSRILTGDPQYLDNWDDIGGYAKIVADRFRRTNHPNTEGKK